MYLADLTNLNSRAPEKGLKTEDNNIEKPVSETEWINRITLALIPGLGPITARKLLKRFGTAGSVLSASRFKLEKVYGVGWNLASSIISNKKQKERAALEFKFINDRKLKALFVNDDSYPYRLKQIPDAPLLLYKKGSCELNAMRVLAIVGTRKATEEGLEFTRKIIQNLASQELLIVSGLALGIDKAAHVEALRSETRTVAVLGHGLDRIYPFEHSSLAAEIAEDGALLSEFPSGTKPDKQNFPLRNRIIAGLSDATLVVEAAEKGGALITARLASEYSRDVFAQPGRPGDYLNKGCNKLIRDNVAGLVSDAQDLAMAMSWTAVPSKAQNSAEIISDLPPGETRVYHLVTKHKEISHDELYHDSGMNHSELSLAIINLELKGLIKSLAFKRYKPA